MINTPLIILHGWNLHKGKYSPLVEELQRKKYKVYCPDLPGFGLMPKPEKVLFLDDYVNYVISFMNRNRINSAIFICHSFGGRIGIKLSAFYPGKVHKLILTGVPGVPPVSKLKINFFYKLAKIGKFIFSLPFLSNYRNIAQKLIYRAARATDFYNTDQKMRETFQAIVKENLSGYLKKIKVPTLLLWGKKDLIVPSSIAQLMHTIIPNNKLQIVENTAHSFPFSHSDLFVRNIENFIKDKHV